MRRLSRPLLLCALCLFSHAQTVQPALTTAQIRFFTRFFARIGSADLAPSMLAHTRTALPTNFNLNPAETNLVLTAAESFRTTMTQVHASETALTAGKSTLSAADLATMAQLTKTRDQAAATLATGLLKSVRPETATLLLQQATSYASLLAKMGVNLR